MAAATDPRYGDVVLAEVTQPFNVHDSTYYHPLHRQTVAALGGRPTNVTADAAFDAWHIYQTCADTGGLAAISSCSFTTPTTGRSAIRVRSGPSRSRTMTGSSHSAPACASVT